MYRKLYTLFKEAIAIHFAYQELVGSKEGSGGQQMTPELLNKGFSMKPT